MKLKRVIYLVCSFLLSCQEYVQDPIDPRIPKYTESGRDVAGALINGNPWISDGTGFNLYGQDDIDLVYYAPQDSLIMRMSGRFDDHHLNVIINLNKLLIESLIDFRNLQGQTITLDGISHQGVIDMLHFVEPLGGGLGQVYFRKVTFKEHTAGANWLVMSGTFSFTIPGSYDVTHGRFDYSVSDNDFKSL